MCPTVGKVSNFSPRGRQTVLLFNSLEAISLYLCRVRKFAVLLQKSMGVLLMRVLYRLSKDALSILVLRYLFLYSRLAPLAQKPAGAKLKFLHMHLLKNIVQISIFLVT